MENLEKSVEPVIEEVEKIFNLLCGFFEASKLGTREELVAQFKQFRESPDDQIPHLSNMLADVEKELRNGKGATFNETLGLQIQAIITYNSLAHCAAAMRPGLSVDEQWRFTCWAHNYLGRLRGTISGEVMGTLSTAIGMARKGATVRHRENREMKKEVFEWLTNNMKKFSSLDGAAEAIAGDIMPVKFRTARDWVGQWKKLQSADTQ